MHVKKEKNLKDKLPHGVTRSSEINHYRVCSEMSPDLSLQNLSKLVKSQASSLPPAKRSCGKVMFSQVSVSHSVDRGGWVSLVSGPFWEVRMSRGYVGGGYAQRVGTYPPDMDQVLNFMDRWPMTTWFDLWATWLGIQLAQTGHLKFCKLLLLHKIPHHLVNLSIWEINTGPVT